MILKAYETDKIDINKNNLVLFYGENQGVKEEEISKILRTNKNKTLVKYEEQQIYKLSPDKIYKLIFDINEIELQIKKNANNSVNIISNFILEKTAVN